MAQIYLGLFRGFGDSSAYGCFNVYFNYTASGTTLSNMSLSFSKDVDAKYTTNTAYIDSISIGGVGYSCSPTSKALSSYNKAGNGWTSTITGSYSGGSSVSVIVKMHRSGQSGSAQTLSGTVTGLATAPTGVWCSIASYTETSVTLSGGYSSNGGAGITSSGFQYFRDGPDAPNTWTNCGQTVSGLVPGAKYWFRYYVGNSVGTTSSNGIDCTTFNYPYIITNQCTQEFTIGNALTIALYNPRGHSCAVYGKGNDGSEIFNGTTNSTVMTGFNDSGSVTNQYKSIPNSDKGNFSVRLVVSALGRDTTVPVGSYKVGTKEIPTFDDSYIIDVKDTLNTAITGDATKFIKAHNKLTGTIKPATSAYYANMDYYSIAANGLATISKTHTGSNIPFELGNMTANALTVTVVDKRKLTKLVTKAITLIDYSNPSIIGSPNITRENGTGDHINISMEGRYTNWSGLAKTNNISSIKFRYKEETGSSWSAWTNVTGFTSSGGTWKLSKLLDIVFSNTKRYNIEFQITDLLETVTLSGYIIPAANAFIWKDLANKRLGINKKPDKTLDINGDINATALWVNGTKMIWYE